MTFTVYVVTTSRANLAEGLLFDNREDAREWASESDLLVFEVKADLRLDTAKEITA